MPAGKKRTRTRLWAKIAGLAIIALILLAFLACGLLMLWGSHRIRREIQAIKALNEPTNWDELLLTDRSGHVVLAADDPAEKEAASLYARALSLSKGWNKELPQEFFTKLSKEALSPEEVQRLGEALSHYQEALDLLRKASTYDGIINLPEATIEPEQQQIDETTAVREAARLLSAQAIHRAIQGRGDEAADACIVLLRYARAFPGYNEMTGLVHFAVVGIACRTIDQTQKIAPSSAEGLNRIMAELGQSVDDEPLTRIFCGERVCGNYLFHSERVKMPRFFLWPNHAAYLELMREAVAASREPFPASLRMGKEIRASHAEIVGPRCTFHIFAAMNSSIIDVLLGNGAEYQTRVRATLASLAIRRARLDGLPLPVSLQELVPKYLPAIPTDPVTGGPLKYRVDESGCSIYGVGHDGVDNGGAIRAVTGSSGRPEEDIVVRLPR